MTPAYALEKGEASGPKDCEMNIPKRKIFGGERDTEKDRRHRKRQKTAKVQAKKVETKRKPPKANIDQEDIELETQRKLCEAQVGESNETDNCMGSDRETQKGEPEDVELETQRKLCEAKFCESKETDNCVGSDTEMQKGEPEDVEHETQRKLCEAQFGESKETDNCMGSDTEMQKGEPEDVEHETQRKLCEAQVGERKETDNCMGSDTEMQKGEPEDVEHETQRKLCEAQFGESKETDNCMGSDTEMQKSDSEDVELETQRNLCEAQFGESKETDNCMGSDTEMRKGKPEDVELETQRKLCEAQVPETDHCERIHSKTGKRETQSQPDGDNCSTSEMNSDSESDDRSFVPDSEELFDSEEEADCILENLDPCNNSMKMANLVPNHSSNIPETDESDDDSLEKVPDILNQTIYLAKIVKSKTTKLGKAKKSDRVYNSTSICPFCRHAKTNFSHHLFSKKHEDEEKVRKIKAMNDNSKEKKKAIELLRLKGNHLKNLEVKEKKKGQIRLFRRKDVGENEEFFDINDYGPCPGCFGWMLKKNLKRHIKTCPSKDENSGNSLLHLVVQSDIISGRISTKACKTLVNEVYTIMKHDDVSKIAKEDDLIVNLGNQWIKRNIGNKVMRRYYTSSIMRLAAKLLIQLREVTGSNMDMASFLKPKHFDHFVVAALKCSKQDAEDDEDLHSPSNSIKLGYDIKRLASAKYALGIASENQKMKKEGKEFLTLMGIHWHTEVTRLAREVLLEKAMHKTRNLPVPSDVRDLAEFMKAKLNGFSVTDKSFSNFKLGATVALARLTLYNRRRSHEVQATRLESYQQRKIGVDAITLEMMRQLTDWEKKLLETQQLMQVRGKMAKAVPVIIPDDTVKVLQYLANPEVRKAAGIKEENRYLFASNGVGVVRAYDAIKKMSDQAGLKMPNLIRTSNMRKYMATMVQCLDTTEAQRQWIITHLGHTMDVHMTHYRQTSDILERVDVAKMLLIQDTNQVGKFVGKKIEDINLEDIVGSDEVEEHESSDGLTQQEEVIPDIFEYHDEALDEPSPKTAQRKGPVRQMWTEQEEKELRVVFKRNFQFKKCPNTAEIQRAVRLSLKMNGVIHKRKPDNIKKKMSNILIKLRQSERQ